MSMKMQMTVRFNRLPKTALATKEATLRLVEKVCADITAGAKVRAPVDTGALRESYSYEVNGTFNGAEGIVYTNIEYAPPQEFGWLGHPGQPHLRPATSDVARQLHDMARALGGSIERAARSGG